MVSNNSGRRTIEQFQAAATLTKELSDWETHLQDMHKSILNHHFLHTLSFISNALHSSISVRALTARTICVQLAPAALVASNETIQGDRNPVRNVLGSLQNRISNWLRPIDADEEPNNARRNFDEGERIFREIWFVIDLMRLAVKLSDFGEAWRARFMLKKKIYGEDVSTSQHISSLDHQLDMISKQIQEDARSFVPRLDILIQPTLYFIGLRIIVKGVRMMMKHPVSTTSSTSSPPISVAGVSMLVLGTATLLAGRFELIEQQIRKRRRHHHSNSLQ